MNPNIETNNTPESQENPNLPDIDGDSDNNLSIADLLKEIKTMRSDFTKAISDVNARLEPTNPVVTPPSSEDASVNNSIEALKADYERKISDLSSQNSQQIKDLKAELARKDREQFTADLRATLSTALSSAGFESVPDAIKAFMVDYPESKFVPGVDGMKIFKKDTKDQGVTLQSLVDGWKESSMGKRFLPATPTPNGTGSTPSAAPTNPTPNTAKRIPLKELVEGVRSGAINFGY